MSDRLFRFRLLRLLPFLVLSTISFFVAAGVSAPRKPFYLDGNLGTFALIDSLGKVEHWKATALVFALAWLGVGSRRLLLAFGLTLGVGLVWEFLEATALGHTGRLSDLAPDLAAAICAFLVALLFRRFWSKLQPDQRMFVKSTQYSVTIMYKPFQIVVVVFLVFFTAAGLVLLVSSIASLLLPADTSGVFVISGGVSTKLFNLIVIAGLLLLLSIAGIYLFSRRRKLR